VRPNRFVNLSDQNPPKNCVPTLRISGKAARKPSCAFSKPWCSSR
jgi:hypothetical protein